MEQSSFSSKNGESTGMSSDPDYPAVQGGATDVPDDSSSNDAVADGVDDGASMTTDNRSTMTYEQKRGPESQLASSETKAVRRMKLIVMLCLLASMTAVAFTAYYLTAQQETGEFTDQFQEDANKILSTMGSNLERSLQAADAFVTSMASAAVTTNQTWPFVVHPDFAVQAEKIRSLANAAYVMNYNWVKPDQREQWQNFTAATGKAWVNESLAVMEEYDGMDWQIIWNYTTWDVIHYWDEFDKEFPGEVGVSYDGPYLPGWQIHPVIPQYPPYNWDLSGWDLEFPDLPSAIQVARDTHDVTISRAYMVADSNNDPIRIADDEETAAFMALYLAPGEEPMEPMSDIYYPVLRNAHKRIQMKGNEGEEYKVEEDEFVAVFTLSVYWRDAIRNILPQGSNGMVVVFENPCSPTFTYKINGPDAVYMGGRDYHDPKYDAMGIESLMTQLGNFAIHDSFYSGLPVSEEYCPFTITVYPSAETEDAHTTQTPLVFAMVAIMVFLFTAATFILYDFWVERRQRLVMKTAVTTTALVASLFPEMVRDRIMPTNDERLSEETLPKGRLQSFLNDGNKNDNVFTEGAGALNMKNSKPIAELFPDTTVFFADIAGFTAWSSVREPANVFTLLESIYGAFDRVARRRGVFKVETIGDSYVAVCGLPEPRRDHALVMAHFATDCIEKMKLTTKELELSLGPGTGDLCLRIGLHSGPTIAGVLRGEKARFQLFGDTVNTASRMESTGLPNKIQISQKTAELIVEEGKGQWLQAREDMVDAKGKGKLQTYWLNRKNRATSAISSTADIEKEPHEDSGNVVQPSLEVTNEINGKVPRLIDWNVAIFQELLEGIVGRRQSNKRKLLKSDVLESPIGKGKIVRDEILEAIEMPVYDSASLSLTKGKVVLDSEVVVQLRNYITVIASRYHGENGFHNFEHASHVIMSTVKLLHRIATRDVKKEEIFTKREYFDYTYGISSDPLTKFSIVFAALIHDVDHKGVSNMQLTHENDPLAAIYNNKSVMEQHSLDLAWSLLMEPCYKDLRACIYKTQAEHDRFRQLCVNCVMATDIFDPELKSFRDSRWERAFGGTDICEEPAVPSNRAEDWNRKATITIEYIIQSSDVAHTMQHWHVYQKWNTCLFKEMYSAYQKGRSAKDPSAGWYEGELWFFDNYVIPLATKLRECKVFGVSCDEFLNFATENRKEWASKGQAIVATLARDNQPHQSSSILEMGN